MIIPFIPHSKERDASVWLSHLQTYLPAHQICLIGDLSDAQKADVEFVVAANPKDFDWSTLPKLKWIHSTWAGVENLISQIDLKQVKVTRLKDPDLAQVMSESVLHWVMHLQHLVVRYAEQQHHQVWQQHTRLSNREYNVAVLGCGELGSHAATALQTLGYKVTGWGNSAKQGLSFNYQYGLKQLEEVVAKASCIVLLLPLTEATRGLINHRFFDGLERSPGLINFARGAIIDETALKEALVKERLSHVVLDVFEEEPLPPSSWMWRHPSVTVLPHISAPTNPQTASKIIASNVGNYLLRGEVPEMVNPDRAY